MNLKIEITPALTETLSMNRNSRTMSATSPRPSPPEAEREKNSRAGRLKDSMRAFFALLLTLLLAAQNVSAADAVTFNGQIAPIIYQNCSSCHRPGEAAPFSLLSYEDTKRKAKTIGKATSSRIMPPWKAEPASYAYRDERRLTEQQITLIQEWVAAGMPEGKKSEKPALPPKFASGWQLGEPDLVVEMPKRFSRPGGRPGYLSQHSGSAGIDRGQMGRGDRHEAIGAVGGASCIVFC